MKNVNSKTQLVLIAATEVFLEHGFTAATTDMIQHKAGVSKATVYTRYANKEELFIAVVENECAKLTEKIKSIQFDTNSLSRSLSDIGFEYLKILLSPNGLGLYRVVIGESKRFPDVGSAFYNAGPRVVLDLLTEQIETAVTQNKIALKLLSSREVATSFLSILRGEAQLQALTYPNSCLTEVQIQDSVAIAVRVFTNAFTS